MGAGVNGRDLALGALVGLAVTSTLARRGSRDEAPAEIAWWHGTSVENAKSILADRLRGRTERGRSFFAPLPGRVYMTQDLGLGLTHAFGALVGINRAKGTIGGFHNYHKKTGVLLQVTAPSTSCVPDEDWLGELLADVARGDLDDRTAYGFARESLSDEGKRGIRRVYWLVSERTREGWRRNPFLSDVATWARIGKTAINQLVKTKDGQRALADIFPHSPHAACLDTDVRVLGAWSLTQEAAKRLRPDGSNLAEVGVQMDAPAKLQAASGSRAKSVHGADLLQRGAEALPDCLGSADHFYHATAFANMAAIAKKGLRPSTGTQSTWGHQRSWSLGKLFLSAGEDAGVAWWRTLRNNGVDVPVLLRIDRSIADSVPIHLDPKGSSDVECSFFTTRPVPPGALSFYDPRVDRYVPVAGWADTLLSLGKGFDLEDHHEVYAPSWAAEDPEWEEEGTWGD